MTPHRLASLLSTIALLAACGGAGVEAGGATGGAGYASGGISAGGGASGMAAGGAGNVTGCPEWPRSQLMPLVGVFFFGPDPGPCTSEDTFEPPTSQVLDANTYNYDTNGRLLSVHSDEFNVDTVCSWNADALVSCTIGKGAGQESVVQSYATGAASLVATSSTSAWTYTETYTLDPKGYPLRAVRTNDSGALLLVSEYAYSDCRLVSKTLTDGVSSVPLPGGITTYTYDASGHISSRSSDDGVSTTYDYTCWNN